MAIFFRFYWVLGFRGHGYALYIFWKVVDVLEFVTRWNVFFSSINKLDLDEMESPFSSSACFQLAQYLLSQMMLRRAIVMMAKRAIRFPKQSALRSDQKCNFSTGPEFDHTSLETLRRLSDV